jgi:hypothetical protein
MRLCFGKDNFTCYFLNNFPTHSILTTTHSSMRSRFDSCLCQEVIFCRLSPLSQHRMNNRILVHSRNLFSNTHLRSEFIKTKEHTTTHTPRFACSHTAPTKHLETTYATHPASTSNSFQWETLNNLLPLPADCYFWLCYSQTSGRSPRRRRPLSRQSENQQLRSSPFFSSDRCSPRIEWERP